jgi:hypothetical protein
MKENDADQERQNLALEKPLPKIAAGDHPEAQGPALRPRRQALREEDSDSENESGIFWADRDPEDSDSEDSDPEATHRGKVNYANDMQKMCLLGSKLPTYKFWPTSTASKGNLCNLIILRHWLPKKFNK